MKQSNNLHCCEQIRNISVQEKFQYSGVPGGECWGVQHPPEIRKTLQNRAKPNPIVKTVKNCWI